MIRTMRAAERELALALADSAADFPEVPEVDRWHDAVQAVAIMCTEAVGRELCRCEGVAYPARPPAPSAAELAAQAERERVAALPPLTPAQQLRIAERAIARRREHTVGCTR